MKKLLPLFCLLASIQTAFSQNSTTTTGSLYQQLKQASTPTGQIAVWTRLAELYGYAGKPDSLKYASEQLLKLATATNEDSLLSKAYVQIGSYFDQISDYKQAVAYQIKSLSLAEKAKSPYDIWLAAKQLGIDFKLLKNYPEALKYLRKAEIILNERKATRLDNDNRTYTHLAEVFLGLGQPDSALRYVQLANEKTSKEKDAYGYGRVLYIFASVYRAKGETDLAESFYKKCIAFSDTQNVYLPFVTASIDYGQYLFDSGQYDRCKSYSLNGFTKASQAGNKLQMINAAALLRKVYYTLGQKDSSYCYATLKDAYSDSVFSEHQRNEIQNLSFAQQIKEKEDEARLAEEQHQRNQNIQYALIALGIIVLITLYLLLSRSFITNTKLIEFFGVVALLIVFEFLNLLLHPFLERITHHNPVLMLLALVCIAALLVPLHHKAEKWATAKLVEKNKQIRLAAAKKTIEQLDTKTEDKSD